MFVSFEQVVAQWPDTSLVVYSSSGQTHWFQLEQEGMRIQIFAWHTWSWSMIIHSQTTQRAGKRLHRSCHLRTHHRERLIRKHIGYREVSDPSYRRCNHALSGVWPSLLYPSMLLWWSEVIHNRADLTGIEPLPFQHSGPPYGLGQSQLPAWVRLSLISCRRSPPLSNISHMSYSSHLR